MTVSSSALPTFTLKPSAYPPHPDAPAPPTLTWAIVGSIAGIFLLTLLNFLIKASMAAAHAKSVSVPTPKAPQAPQNPPVGPLRPSSSSLSSFHPPPSEHELSTLFGHTSPNPSLPRRSMAVSSSRSRFSTASHSFRTSEISSLGSRVFFPEPSENTSNLGFGQMPLRGESDGVERRVEYQDTVLSWDPYAEEEGRS